MFPMCGTLATFRTLSPEVKPIHAIQAIDPLVVDLPAFPAEQYMDAFVSIPYTGIGNFFYPHAKRGLIISLGFISV